VLGLAAAVSYRGAVAGWVPDAPIESAQGPLGWSLPVDPSRDVARRIEPPRTRAFGLGPSALSGRPLRLYAWNVWGRLDTATREVIDALPADVVLLNDQRSVLEHWRWVEERAPLQQWQLDQFSCVSFGPRLALFQPLENPNFRAPVVHLGLQEGNIGVDVFVFHAHTPVGSAQQQLKYLAEPDVLLREIGALTAHRRTIIAGDFNSPSPLDGPAPYLYSARRFLERGYVDSYAEMSPAPREPTKIAGNNAGRRIDFFFVSEDLRAAIAGGGVHTGTSFPEHSDHRPIWIDLDLSRLANDGRGNGEFARKRRHQRDR